MRMFTVLLSIGNGALAITAIAVLLAGLWKYAIQPALKIGKVYKSIGQNGRETVFELLHRIANDVSELKDWRQSVDDELSAQSVTLETLMKRGE
jgi:hypothetical protein